MFKDNTMDAKNRFQPKFRAWSAACALAMLLVPAQAATPRDTLVIAPHVDQTILVVRSGSTPRRVVLRALGLLRKANAKVAGFVLNRLPTGRIAGYYYYYYGDKYEKDSAYGGNGQRAA